MLGTTVARGRMGKFSIANMMTSDWGRFKGPPSASEWSFGSTGKSNAAQGGDMLTVSPGGLSHGQTACEPARGQGGS